MACSSDSCFIGNRPLTETASVSLTKIVSGCHWFKIEGYSGTKGIGIGNYITSGVFSVAGHDWAIRYYPDGESTDNDSFISAYLVLSSDHTDVKAAFNINLVDQNRKPSSTNPMGTPRVFKNRGYIWGYRKFLEKAKLESSEYLKDDCFLLLCRVDVIKSPQIILTNTRTVVVPPSNLHEHFGHLLESGDGADVTFEVGERTFNAHRCILAARSPVFKAQLYGPMLEKSLNHLKIDDIEDEVFSALLHFIYTDSLPAEDYLSASGEEEDNSAPMAQHLLVAADRYGVERLKLVCEEKLCQNINLKTVTTTLALAEQHHCHQLKAACFDFLSAPGMVAAVVSTEGFEHLMKSCPVVLKDFLLKLTNG